MSAVRLRRLAADFARLREYVSKHPRLELVQHQGDPPERYQIRFEVRSLRQTADGLAEATDHLVEIVLPRDYPRVPPQSRMLTPVFHPNIAPHAICIGDHWSAGESLASIVARIGEMLAYQSYNTKSPLNGEAARWVAENAGDLPLDPVNMVPEDAGPPTAAPVPPAAHAAVVAATPTPAPPLALDAGPGPAPAVPEPVPPAAADGKVGTRCPLCSATLRVPRAAVGKPARCPRCREVFRVAEEAGVL